MAGVPMPPMPSMSTEMKIFGGRCAEAVGAAVARTRSAARKRMGEVGGGLWGVNGHQLAANRRRRQPRSPARLATADAPGQLSTVATELRLFHHLTNSQMTSSSQVEWRVQVGDETTSAVFEPAAAGGGRAVFVCAHGAGGNMSDKGMLATTRALGARGLGIVRFNFLYKEKHSG